MFKLLVQLRLGSVLDWSSDLLTTAVTDDSKITSYPEDVRFLSHLRPTPNPVSTAWAELNVTPRQRCHPPLLQELQPPPFPHPAPESWPPVTLPLSASPQRTCPWNVLKTSCRTGQTRDSRMEGTRLVATFFSFPPPPTSEVCNLSHPCWWHVDAWDVAQGK